MSISPGESKRHPNGMRAARNAERLRTALIGGAETFRTVWTRYLWLHISRPVEHNPSYQSQRPQQEVDAHEPLEIAHAQQLG